MTKNLLVKLYILILVAFTWATGVKAAERGGRVFFVFDASNGMADNSAQTIKCTKTGRMVISTIGHINFYDGLSFVHIDPKQEDAFPLPKYNGHYHLYFDKFHHLWLKDKRLVTCVDLLTERFIPNVQGVIKDMGMDHPVDDLFGDHDAHIWFLSGQHLYCPELEKVMPVTQRDNAELQDIDVYDDQLLLQFFSDGMVSAHQLSDGRQVFAIPAQGEADDVRYSRSAVVCPYGKSYFMIRNGEQEAVLLRFDVDTRQWVQLMATPYHLNNMAIHNECIYIASEYGYWTYDLLTGEQHHVEELTLTKGRRLVTDINTLEFDRQGGMWVGTEKRGLLYSKPFASAFHRYTWEQPEAAHYAALIDRKLGTPGELPRRVNCIYRDSRGWTWTGLYTGLQLLKEDGGKPEVFTRRDGLMNEMIHSIVEDDQHNIWVSTSYGISNVIIRDGRVYHIESYTSQDNVPNESFVNGRAIRLDDGTIVMQSLDHLVTFRPEDFHQDSLRNMKLYPKLIKLMVDGRNVEPGMEIDGRVILERSITRTRELSVEYFQNSITLTFSGLNYLRPMQTYYRVRIEGIYDDWRVFSYANSAGMVDSRGMLHLPLMGLRPGSYTIELQASLAPDYWPQEPFRWVVNVKEPWWRTTGVYLSLVFLLLALGVGNFYLYNRNTRMRMIRSTQESDILKRLRTYAERCDALSGEVLTPYTSQVMGDSEEAEMSKEFVESMLKIVPFVRKHRDQNFTVHDLSEATRIPMEALYGSVSDSLYKSPRPLAAYLRLQEAARLLAQTDKSIEDIADECRFVSPNYFIAAFYHQYRQTPEDYRNSTPR